MRHARPEIVTLVIDENLRLVFQLAKGRGMKDPVTVTLERCSGNKLACLVTMLGLGMKATTRPRPLTGIGREFTALYVRRWAR